MAVVVLTGGSVAAADAGTGTTDETRGMVLVNEDGAADPNERIGGPAPEWFKDPGYRPTAPQPTEDADLRGSDPNVKIGGPAPDWFKDPSFSPFEPMPQVESAKVSGGSDRVSEPFVPMPYCRNVYGTYYWMSTSANVASCTQGYVKYYDSRNGDYLAFYDVYVQYWNTTRSTALTTAVNWCTSNWICSVALETLLVSKVKPAWELIRAVRYGL